MDDRFRNIVVGVDGSTHADAAVDTAGDLASKFGARLHLVIATHGASTRDWQDALESLPREFWDSIDLHADAHEVLAAAQQRLAGLGVDVETHLSVEHPADALIGVAEREHADLIVVGSHGRRKGPRRFLGSVSSKMAHHAPCSVLIAGQP